MDHEEKKDPLIKIEFQVTCPTTNRFVTFGEHVHPNDIREWFIKAAMGVETLFATGSMTCILMLDNQPILNKIGAIKLVREFTGVGLKEAKDLIECTTPDIIPGFLMICPSLREAESIQKIFVVESGTHLKIVPGAKNTGGTNLKLPMLVPNARMK